MQINYLATVIIMIVYYRMQLQKKYTYYEHITALLAALQCELILKSFPIIYIGPHKMWRSEGLNSIIAVYMCVQSVVCSTAWLHGASYSVLKWGEDMHQKWARSVCGIGGRSARHRHAWENFYNFWGSRSTGTAPRICTEHWSLYGRHFPHFNIKLKLL